MNFVEVPKNFENSFLNRLTVEEAMLLVDEREQWLKKTTWLTQTIYYPDN